MCRADGHARIGYPAYPANVLRDSTPIGSRLIAVFTQQALHPRSRALAGHHFAPLPPPLFMYNFRLSQPDSKTQTMEAERLNIIANTLQDLSTRSTDLRRYL